MLNLNIVTVLICFSIIIAKLKVIKVLKKIKKVMKKRFKIIFAKMVKS